MAPFFLFRLFSYFVCMFCTSNDGGFRPCWTLLVASSFCIGTGESLVGTKHSKKIGIWSKRQELRLRFLSDSKQASLSSFVGLSLSTRTLLSLCVCVFLQ